MTHTDFADFDKFRARILRLGDFASERNCLLYVDAEQTFIQAAIESFGQQMTHRLNVGDKTIVMNGYQNYLKRMKFILPMEVQASRTLGFNLGVKMVRGAYMNEERHIAAGKGVESPVWDTIEGTHACYNNNMQLILRSMKPQDKVFLGSHNVDTVEQAKALVTELGLKQYVYFGQLRGFSDQVTNQLAMDGFNVFKYLPFGPTDQVMPYLVRRGQESRQVLREQKFQNEFLKKEIYSRFRL